MNPIPLILHCPECGARHVDAGEFATKIHTTHSCQTCGLTWRPAVVPTVGVQFLPGFKDGAPVPSRYSGDSSLDSAREEIVSLKQTVAGQCDRIRGLVRERDEARAHAHVLQNELETMPALRAELIDLRNISWSRRECQRLIHRAIDALSWCSGSSDFSPGGVAHLGWEHGPAPLLRELLDWMKANPREKP